MRDHPALKATDPELHDLILSEEQRQFEVIRLIPSENYVSQAVLEATGTVLTNKYSEGYPGKRYYEGQEFIDQVEALAQARARSLFGADHANVQPYSGSPANLATYLALTEPGAKIMGLALPHGGHLTHGWKVSVTSRVFQSVQYQLSKETGRIDYDELRDMALRERPAIIISGATAYPRLYDFQTFGQIAREVGARHVADIAHIAGLVAAGVHPSPVPHADAVTTTTHKTLRGPRGAMILCPSEHAQAIDRAVFPGLQGGPHNHTTAAIAVALREASTAEFKKYGRQIVANAAAFAEELLAYGFELVTGGTENHLILIDLSNKGATGRQAASALNAAGIVCNANMVPHDSRSPFDPSGIRVGTPAVTSRGMKETEMRQIAGWMSRVVSKWQNEELIAQVKGEVRELCRHFPPPGIVWS